MLKNNHQIKPIFSNEFVKFSIIDSTGLIFLTYSAKLNVLNYDMVMAILSQLKIWRDDTDITQVIINAEGDKAFCAGGDISQIYHAFGKEINFPRFYLYNEYLLNTIIKEYPKPIISLMFGITMGGGVGIGGHCSHRLVFASSKVAMPECNIGFIPDVGGSYLLKSAPNTSGIYYGLTGSIMNPADAIYCGFADYYADEMPREEIIKHVIKDGTNYLDKNFPKKLADQENNILQGELMAHLFNHDDLQIIIAKCQADSSEIAKQALCAMNKNSHLSKNITLRHLRDIKNDNFRQVIRKEYRIAERLGRNLECKEGIRAQIIDKDRNPKWHGTINDKFDINSFFAPLDDELKFELIS